MTQSVTNDQTALTERIDQYAKLTVRLDEMQELYASGKSLREVGDEFDISSQRVAQIFHRHGVKCRKRGSRPATTVTEPRKDKVIASYLAGVPRRTLAADYGLSQAAIGRIIGERLTQGEVRERSRARQSRMETHRDWTDWELIESLQACARDLGKAQYGPNLYAEWRKREAAAGNARPSLPLYNARRPGVKRDFGTASWREWRTLAGLPTQKGGGKTRFSDDDIFAALSRIEAKLGGFPSLREYDDHRLPTEPSAAAIRRRHSGKWGVVRDCHNARSKTDWATA